jgi:hypothetical protein
MSFRHFVLGAVAIFIYVGVEVGIPNVLQKWLQNGGLNVTTGAEAIAGTVTATYWLLMLVGRLVGAVIGSLEKSGEYSACVRKSDLAVTGSSVALADQDDLTTVSASTAYHGKAAAADATASSVAKTLGWDEAIWDLSGAVPALK